MVWEIVFLNHECLDIFEHVSKINFFFGRGEGEGEQMGCKYDISFGFPTSQSVTPPGKSLSCACIYVGCMHRRSAMPTPMPTLEYAFC